MKKSALVAAVLAATTMSTTAFAAQNPFKDLPEGHWAYDAVTMLAEDGVLEGYGDGNFQGGKLMNRYEMAEIVAKASEKYGTAALKDKGVLRKLEREFATELKDMDVRLTAVENDVQTLKKGMSSFKWWGDARVRAFKNKNLKGVSGGVNASDYQNNVGGTKNQNELRLRLGFYGEPAENLSITGQMKVESTNIARSDYDHGHYESKFNDEKFHINRAQLDWRAKNNFIVSIGRNEVSLGQGLIYWENPIDAIMVRKNFGDRASLLIGAGDANCGTYQNNTENAVFADLKYKVSPAVTLTTSYYNAKSDSTGWNYGYTDWNGSGNYYGKEFNTERKFRQFAYGINAQLADKWNLIAEGVHNGADVKRTGYTEGSEKYPDEGRNGWWTRLTYGKIKWDQGGTWHVYGEYFHLGGLAVDSSGWAHRLNIAGGNGYGGNGAKGWGLGASYMLAPNTNFELTYYMLKPVSGIHGVDKYDSTAYASLSYSF